MGRSVGNKWLNQFSIPLLLLIGMMTVGYSHNHLTIVILISYLLRELLVKRSHKMKTLFNLISLCLSFSFQVTW